MTLPHGYRLRSLEEFRAARSLPFGYILITDEPTSKKRIHSPPCENVAEGHFVTKVIDNREVNGSYYLFLCLEDAPAGADMCGNCRPA